MFGIAPVEGACSTVNFGVLMSALTLVLRAQQLTTQHYQSLHYALSDILSASISRSTRAAR